MDYYVSYRCISGRDRNGIACSLGNKYYSGTKLEKEVKEVISAMVTMPEFVEVVAKKIDIQTDIGTLKKKKSAIEADIKKYTANVIQTGKRISELDVEDKHYERRLETLNGVLDDLYEKLDEAEKRHEELCRDIATIEKSVMTKESIFDMLKAFSEYYDVLEDEDKKKFLQAIVRSIEIYPNRTKKAHWIKRINFSFPVTYDGESGALVVSNNDSTVETVVTLSRKIPDDVIEIDLDLDELDLTSVESKATYPEIKEYVLDRYGLKVSSLFIAQVKRKCGLDVGENYNLPKPGGRPQPQVSPEKEEAIKAALKHFAMI